jgi:hypothetical protein
MQYVNIKEALRDTGEKLAEPPKVPREVFKCGECGRFVTEREYYETCYHGEPCRKCEDA